MFWSLVVLFHYVGAYYPYCSVLQFAPWCMGGDAVLTMGVNTLTHSVVLQKFTPKDF
jgi:hypothetical protein